jgi:hypothetical protein
MDLLAKDLAEVRGWIHWQRQQDTEMDKQGRREWEWENWK